MGLGKYFRKRNFGETPEPRGNNGVANKHGRGPAGQSAPSSSSHKAAVETEQPRLASPHKKLAFVIQEHHASRLHYDFRLEMDGVLKSWAIPKGPSMDPSEHHLAVHVEDHPYEYRKFAGTIPHGNYGAGEVKIWDEGWYEARKGQPKDNEKTLLTELAKGHLTFILHGKKLHGEFALIQMHSTEDKDNWLLVKKGDQFAEKSSQQDTEIAQAQTAEKAQHELGLQSYPKAAKPWNVQPMLCTLIDEPFSKAGWLFEIKWDGYRAIGSKHASEINLYSRRGNSFLEKYPPVAEALHTFKHDVIVDGEIVIVDETGTPHFEWLQNWHAQPHGTLRYYLFDILWCDGHDVRTMPLRERKALLKKILPQSDVLQLSDDIEKNGLGLFHQMESRHLEGIVAKKADSQYHENERANAWLKAKTHLRQEVVIGGYTEPRGGRKYLGSLLVGVYNRGNFVFVGHSGGGIADEQRKLLRDKLAKLERKTSPFLQEPKPNAPVHWTRPKLVCEMSFSEWTSDGSMRQPKYEGLRPDKKPEDVRREKPKNGVFRGAPEAGSRAKANERILGATERQDPSLPKPPDFDLPFEPTHLDKVFFPKIGITKGDMFAYYESVADFILPYLKDRACSLNRMPSGITGDSFFQKNNDHLPGWVPHANIFSETNNANLHWIKGGDLSTLLYMVQLGCVEINPWNSRAQHLDKPDWIVIDLDPEGMTFKDVVAVAKTVHEVCDEWKIPAYPKTSGKTGIHIFIPMGAKYTYEQAKNLAHLIVLEVNKRQPKLTSVERMPAKRPHKIYLDFLQNREGQTLAAPYSLRPTPDATVSMPLHWDEVTSGLKPTNFTIKNAAARLKHRGDLWKPVMGPGINLNKILKNLE